MQNTCIQSESSQSRNNPAAESTCKKGNTGMIGFQPVITNFYNGRVLSARCSACDAELDLGDEVVTVEDTDGKLMEALSKHVREAHQR